MLCPANVCFACAGGKLPWQVVLVLGFSNIVADALSMGTGEYMSSKAHQEFAISEKKREEWSVMHKLWMMRVCGVR